MASCDDPAPTYTPEEAIQYVAEVLPTLVIDNAGMPGRLKKTYDVLPGDSFLVMTAYKFQDALDVNIEWKTDQAEKITFKKITASGGLKVENRTQVNFLTVYEKKDVYSGKITGTITCGEATPVEVYFKVDVKHLTVIETSIKEFKEGFSDAQYNKNLANPTFKSADTVSVYGYVTATFEPTEGHLHAGVWIQNGVDGIQLYAGNLAKFYFDLELDFGDLVRVIGYGSGYSGLLEIKPNLIEKIEEKGDIVVADPVVTEYANAENWSAAGMLNKDGNIAVMKNLTLKTRPTLNTGSHWTLKFEGTKADGETKVEVQLYVNYHIGTEAQEAVKTVLESLVIGQTRVDLKGPIAWYNAPQFNLVFFEGATPAQGIIIHP